MTLPSNDFTEDEVGKVTTINKSAVTNESTKNFRILMRIFSICLMALIATIAAFFSFAFYQIADMFIGAFALPVGYGLIAVTLMWLLFILCLLVALWTGFVSFKWKTAGIALLVAFADVILFLLFILGKLIRSSL